MSKGSRIIAYGLKSGLVFGIMGFILGFVGPMIITPNANQGPLLGIFITGPAGFIVGSIIGFVVGRIKERIQSKETAAPLSSVPKIWTGVLWFCGILSVTVIAIGIIYIPWHESKYSCIIDKSTDLQKRDKTLTSLHVRSLSDDDLIKIDKFANLDYLDFDSGWAVEEAKLTDSGLKNLSQLNLPKLEMIMLGHCNKITDEGMKYLAQIKTLKYLSLAACPRITDVGLSYLASSTSIETVDMRGCTEITDRGLGNLKRMPKLKEVLLGGCKNISQAGIEELRRALPQSKIEKDDQEWAMH
jgi:hypothetical protein